MAVNLQTLRDLATDKCFGIAGEDAAVTRPWENPIPAKVFWLDPLDEPSPIGRDYARRGPRWLLAVRRSEVPELQRGSLINGSGPPGSTISTWQVDSMELVNRECFYVGVIPEPTGA